MRGHLPFLLALPLLLLSPCARGRPVSVQMTVEASSRFWKVVDARVAPPPAPK